MSSAPDPIETYLDDIATRFGAHSPKAMRDLLNEVEAHLRDSTEQAIASGCSEDEAKVGAVASMGAPSALALEDQTRLRTPMHVVVRQTLLSALQLGSIAAIAIGASGLIAEAIHLVWGTSAVVDVTPGQALHATDCARWLAQDPTAGTCHTAALNDWLFEVVGYRLFAGLLGVVGLIAYQVIARSGRSRSALLLPNVVTNTTATVLFMIAGLWTLAMGIDLVAINSGRGSGQWFSAAPIALGAAFLFGRRLAHEVRSPLSILGADLGRL